MFGYVTINKPELKIKDFEQYRGYYCGLCHTLKKRHGRIGQLTLTYDMTFLVILLTSLYEYKTEVESHHCVIHPVKKKYMLMNRITEYAADMNVVLAYYHFLDDWEDEKKIKGLLGKLTFRQKYNRIKKKYPRQCKKIEESLQTLAKYEHDGETDIDTISRPFGELMAELFIYEEDAFEKTLRQFGFYLGKYIYLMDAAMDIEDDIKNGCYNPFTRRYQDPDYDEWIKERLTWMITEVISLFEQFPLEWDIHILRNILYEGVWDKYERKRENGE